MPLAAGSFQKEANKPQGQGLGAPHPPQGLLRKTYQPAKPHLTCWLRSPVGANPSISVGGARSPSEAASALTPDNLEDRLRRSTALFTPFTPFTQFPAATQGVGAKVAGRGGAGAPGMEHCAHTPHTHTTHTHHAHTTHYTPPRAYHAHATTYTQPRAHHAHTPCTHHTHHRVHTMHTPCTHHHTYATACTPCTHTPGTHGNYTKDHVWITASSQ